MMLSIFKSKKKREQELIQEKETVLQETFLKQYSCTLDTFDQAIDYNPYLDQEEKELLRQQKSYFLKYPLDHYEELIKKVLTLKIDYQKPIKDHTVMKVSGRSIISYIKKEDPIYLDSLKHELVHYVNKNFDYTYTHVLNEGFTNLLAEKIYGLELSKMKYLYRTIFTRMICEIMGYSRLIKDYQTANVENSVIEELQSLLGKEKVSKLFYKVVYIEELEYCMYDILKEAKEWKQFKRNRQEEYVEYYLETQLLKKEVMKQIENFHLKKFGISYKNNKNIIRYEHDFLLNVHELKGISSLYINHGLLKDINKRKSLVK